MPVPIEKRYEHVLSQLRFASEMRFKIYAAWGAIYAALAATFVWVRDSDLEQHSWIVPMLGIWATVVCWLAELRNRPALGSAKSAGLAIENDASSEIPENQRYFADLNKGVRFGIFTDVSAVLAIGLLILAACRLFR